MFSVDDNLVFIIEWCYWKLLSKQKWKYDTS